MRVWFLLVCLMGLPAGVFAIDFSSFVGEKLVVSNYPESFRGPGTFFRLGIKNTPLRLLFHHKSLSRIPLNLVLTLKNSGDKSVDVGMIRSVFGPSTDEIYVGFRVVEDFLQKIEGRKIEHVLLLPGQTKQVIVQEVREGQILSGMVKLHKVSGPLEVSWGALDPTYDAFSGLDTQQGYTYGLFNDSVRALTVTCDGRLAVQEIPIGEAPFLVDDHHHIELKGNYGVLYHISILFQNPHQTPQIVRLYFSPVGGPCRAVVLQQSGEILTTGMAQIGPELMGEFVVEPHSEEKVALVTMPESGAFYPANLVLQMTPDESGG